MSTFRLVCAGCGTPAAPVHVEPYPFRCRCATPAGVVDHVIAKIAGETPPIWPEGVEENPFAKYRLLLHSWHTAQELRVPDAEYLAIVQRLDDAVERVCGQRFRVTRFDRCAALGRELGIQENGGLWVKDETGNVSGSHKGRHLAGIMLYLQVLEAGLQALGPAEGDAQRPDLAIASCGNAALAAAVIARAAGWTLRTFIPPEASPSVVERLRELGAALVVCRRAPGETGDPCYGRFKEAVAEGALAFCCQGPDNGLTIEGGETIAYEIVDRLGDIGLDAVVVQVGGGALASACVQGFERARALGRLRAMPRVYTVQTEGAAPLARAFERVAAHATRTSVEAALRYAVTHRPEFMWPWETEPRSIAHGILDDETYDWLAAVSGMLSTGGAPVVVSEALLDEANQVARELTGINVDHTGSAGLAGLMALRSRGAIQPHEQVAVIFTGARR